MSAGDGVKQTVTTTATGGTRIGASFGQPDLGSVIGGTKANGPGTIYVNLGF